MLGVSEAVAGAEEEEKEEREAASLRIRPACLASPAWPFEAVR